MTESSVKAAIKHSARSQQSNQKSFRLKANKIPEAYSILNNTSRLVPSIKILEGKDKPFDSGFSLDKNIF